MSEQQNFGFGKFVPGFDFLQNLAKGASQNIPQLPNLSSWVAPTLNLEELQKRIDELKAVHFWLDQNSKALGATVQALELQKMTLATLKGMNFNMADVADSLKLKTADSMFAEAKKTGEKAAAAAPDVAVSAKTSDKSGAAAQPSTGGVVDPLQWWGALTQQFQQIAAGAMNDAAKQTAAVGAKNMATGVAGEVMKTATSLARAATGTAGGRHSAGSPAAAKKAARKTSIRGR